MAKSADKTKRPYCPLHQWQKFGEQELEGIKVRKVTVGTLTHLGGRSGTGGISTVLVLSSADFADNADGEGERELFRLLPKNARGSSFLFTLVGVTASEGCVVEDVDGIGWLSECLEALPRK